MTGMAVSSAESWLPVPDWPGYEVSDRGRVRSIERQIRDGRTAGGLILKQTPSGAKKYLHVTLSDGWRTKRVAVHQLVKRVHTGPSRGRQVRHLDDDKTNNHLSNLKYGTQKQNEQDKKRNRGKREREEKREEGEKKRVGIERQFETGEASRAPEAVSGCLAGSGC